MGTNFTCDLTGELESNNWRSIPGSPWSRHCRWLDALRSGRGARFLPGVKIPHTWTTILLSDISWSTSCVWLWDRGKAHPGVGRIWGKMGRHHFGVGVQAALWFLLGIFAVGKIFWFLVFVIFKWMYIMILSFSCKRNVGTNSDIDVLKHIVSLMEFSNGCRLLQKYPTVCKLVMNIVPSQKGLPKLFCHTNLYALFWLQALVAKKYLNSSGNGCWETLPYANVL